MKRAPAFLDLRTTGSMGLAVLVARRGRPDMIVSDNGTQLTPTLNPPQEASVRSINNAKTGL